MVLSKSLWREREEHQNHSLLRDRAEDPLREMSRSWSCGRDHFRPCPTTTSTDCALSSIGHHCLDTRVDNDEHKVLHSPPYTSETSLLLSTPKMSHRDVHAFVLGTPPLILTTGLPTAPSFSSQQTPIDTNYRYQCDSLEPPAWKPAEPEEIEYVESWNNSYNHQQFHFLNGYHNQRDDSSSICSFQTNSSLVGYNCGKMINTTNRSHNYQTLRPRGLSVNSYRSISRNPSFGSCPQNQQHGQSHHHRHESLPVSLLSSNHNFGGLTTQEQTQSQPSFSQSKLHDHQQKRMHNSNDGVDCIQPRLLISRYETYYQHHVSGVRVDAILAGLKGTVAELYIVDRCIDGFNALMQTIKEKVKSGDDFKNSEKNSFNLLTKCCITFDGTVKHLQDILELYRVDKMVDRFKRELQMPLFSEEDLDAASFKYLLDVDLLVDEKNRTRNNEVGVTEGESNRSKSQNNIHSDCQVDLNLDEKDDDWDSLEGENGNIYFPPNSWTSSDHQVYKCYDSSNITTDFPNSSNPITDLHEIIDMLQSDIEIDSVAHRRKDLEMVQPLLKIDHMMEQWKRQLTESLCQQDVIGLHLVDVQVDSAKRKFRPKSNQEIRSELHGTNIHPVPSDSNALRAYRNGCSYQSEEFAGQYKKKIRDIKDELDQHLPQLSSTLSPLNFHSAPLELRSTSLPPPPPPQASPAHTKLCYSSSLPVAELVIGSQPSFAPKRSIFSQREKLSAAQHCAYSIGSVLPGTTTVIVTNGSSMIDDIPVGKILLKPTIDSEGKY